MRVLIQRVKRASVLIDGACYGEIGQGLLLLVGFESEDHLDDLVWMAKKVVQLRIFDDNEGVMNRSILDINDLSEAIPGLLVVSQFTLHASTKKGNRPSYIRAAVPDVAIPLYESFIQELRYLFPGPVETGRFGAEMEVGLVNDGPVTIWIDTKNKE
ncbi:MAG: D-tyrosyl-tRNA(Tyr) deacylase [Prevotellaceae bacterium]|jgi:D-tyrosyl-tRNA(Tyr) deacylase|nr:D-tyrosyl-tRNA(Tyr) deacylase [Prevotellaceae bacterium]